LAQFLTCWFLPGFLVLSLGIANKHNHYSIPILPPLTIAAAAGIVHYVRRQHRLDNVPHAVVAIVLLAACGVAAFLAFRIRAISTDLQGPILIVLAILACSGSFVIWAEHRRRFWPQVVGSIAIVWLVAVAVQTWVMPKVDDYRAEAEFGRKVTALVPPGETVRMIGTSEEAQEAQYAFYVDRALQRVSPSDSFQMPRPNGPLIPNFEIWPRSDLKDYRVNYDAYSGAPHLLFEQRNVLRPNRIDSDGLLLLAPTTRSTAR
jgi:4-amino-4-deoxy-L-arabinose transferase-like glycosyltransferase